MKKSLSHDLKKHKSCFQYTALGNSVAFGIGATNNYGYTNYFRDFLSTLHPCVKFKNLAVPGFTSSNLLTQLKQDARTRKNVKKAKIITISIGGNNLLACATEGNTNINDACAANGVLNFIKDWPQIMNEIRNSIGSKAQILVMTVYNPIPGDNPLYTKVENYLQQINYVIRDLGYQFLYHYRVADVHLEFQGQFPNGSWKVCTWTHFCEPTLDPHPTNSGYIEIARLHEAVYCNHQHYNKHHCNKHHDHFEPESTDLDKKTQ